MPTYTVAAGINIATDFTNGRKLVRLSDGTLWCCYTFWNVATGMYEVRASYSINGGLTWTEEIVAVPAGGHDEDYCHYPAMAVDSQDRIHIVYEDHWRINFPLQTVDSIRYCIRDAGAWSAPVTITALRSNNPSIAIDSGDNIHVAYSAVHPIIGQYEIRYICRAGGVWGAEEWVTEVIAPFWGQYYVAIAIDSGDNVHLVWEGTGWGVNVNNYNVQWRMRTGAGWQAQEAITDLAIDQMRPSAAIDSVNNVHVAWFHSAGNGEIRYRLRTGAGWQAQETPSGNGFDPTIALNLTDDIYITYYTTAGIDQIWVVEKPFGGVWQAPVNITNSAWDNAMSILIWANFPNVKTNIPKTGCALVFTADAPAEPQVDYYLSDDLAWRAVTVTGAGLAGALLLLS